jgi:Polysaccharide lyase family 4, domain II
MMRTRKLSSFVRMSSATMILLAVLCLVLVGGQETLAQLAYKQIHVTNGGSIEGTVVLQKTTGIDPVRVTKDQAICGMNKTLQALVLGRKNGVQNAVVFLDGVRQGKEWNAGKTPVLDQHQCEYVPHVVILPSGSALEIVNDDPILHNVHLYTFGSVDQTLCNIAQPVKGQRTLIDQMRTVKARILEATCDAGHPWMNAYIFRADNPYAVVTDRDGKFKLENVPPGDYKLTVWHEGVKVIKTLVDGGIVTKYFYEAPYSLTKEVMVKPGNATRADFEFALR